MERCSLVGVGIAFAAERNGVDTFVTRNKRDFELSPVPVLTPEEYVGAYAPPGINYAEEPLE